jgi:hypothetical protein
LLEGKDQVLVASRRRLKCNHQSPPTFRITT